MAAKSPVCIHPSSSSTSFVFSSLFQYPHTSNSPISGAQTFHNAVPSNPKLSVLVEPQSLTSLGVDDFGLNVRVNDPNRRNAPLN